ncbi:MAG TPA: alpha/beta fold hydrolase [Ferruginibacter sp.]|nr:alpha/beta fold hydrolase [Ferruginibacter sp.]
MKRIAFILLLWSQGILAQQKDIVTPGSNLVIEGIPDIPVSIKNDVQRYTESRGASFSSWHPTKKQMIISTRFANVPQLHVVQMPMGDRKQVTFYEDAITNASYEPIAGKYFLFTKDIGGNEFSQLYRFDVATGEVTMISDGGRTQNGGMQWSRSGKQIAYSSTRRNGADRDVYIMDPANPSTDKRILELNGGGWGILDWSPDDKKLLLLESISANESHYWIADIAAGTKTALTDRDEKSISYSNAAFTSNGKGIYFITDKDNEFRRLSYMDLASGKINYISNIPWDIEGFTMSKDGNQVVFLTNEDGESKLYQMNTNGNKYVKLNNIPQGVYSQPVFHANNRDIAFTINSARSSTDIFVYDTKALTLQRWTESEMGGLVPDQLSMPSLIKWKSFDQREISGFYYQPAKKFTGKRPVMIVIHGGPEGQSRPNYIGANNYFLNEMGVAIILPNVRGSSGYGKTFIALDNGMKREESVKDIGALLDWIANRPELDANRVMVTGGSYGGYMTLAVATNYNDRIKCGLDVVGISNFNTFLKNTESYRRDLRRVEYGDERDTAMSAFFEKIAPLNNAGKIKKPMFIVQGGNDPRVPRTEAVQMADKIKANGGIVWYLEAKDEGHGFRKKSNADFQRLATILFMQKYLLDGM